MQEQFQLMYIQAMLVDNQLCSGSDKQCGLLKIISTLMFSENNSFLPIYFTACHILYMKISRIRFSGNRVKIFIS